MVTVLVVDDEIALAELLSEVLTDAGYHVVTAHNGQEALALLIEAAPDVIVSDIMMPVMDGYMLLRAVRQVAIRVKVVLTSAGSLRHDIEPQPDAFVPKPYDIERIEALVGELSCV